MHLQSIQPVTQYEAAARYYQQALELDKRRNDKEGQATDIAVIADLALECNQWVDARQMFQKELVFAKEVGRQDLIAHAECGLARVWEASGNIHLALSSAEHALKIFERLGLYNQDIVRDFLPDC